MRMDDFEEDICELEEEFDMRLEELVNEMNSRGLKFKNISIEYEEKELK